MDQIRSSVRAFIVSEFLQGEDSAELQDETPLRASGILDSLGTVKLVSFVERTFELEVEPHLGERLDSASLVSGAVLGVPPSTAGGCMRCAKIRPSRPTT